MYVDLPTIASVFSSSPHFLSSFTLRIPLDHRGVILTCLVYGFSTTPNVQWFKITENGQETRVSNNILGDSTKFISSRLIFQNGFKTADAGRYYCSMPSNSTQNAVFMLESGETRLLLPSCSVNKPLVYFQIRVLSTQCEEWDEYLRGRVELQVLGSLQGVLSTECESCPINDDTLALIEQPICRGGAVLFKGVIANTIIEQTEAIFCALYNWQILGPTIVINDTWHHVDRACKLRITSPDEPECGSDVQGAALTSAAVGGSMSGLLVVGAVVGIAVVLVVVQTR